LLDSGPAIFLEDNSIVIKFVVDDDDDDDDEEEEEEHSTKYTICDLC